MANLQHSSKKYAKNHNTITAKQHEIALRLLLKLAGIQEEWECHHMSPPSGHGRHVGPLALLLQPAGLT